jgi:hypothetical protein
MVTKIELLECPDIIQLDFFVWLDVEKGLNRKPNLRDELLVRIQDGAASKHKR